MPQYRIVRARYIQDLVHDVNKWIGFGWAAQGGVCHSPETLQSSEQYTQALVKGKDDV